MEPNKERRKTTRLFTIGGAVPNNRETITTRKPDLGSPDMLAAFPNEFAEAVRPAQTNTPSNPLDGPLARNALIPGHRETQSIVQRRVVEV